MKRVAAIFVCALLLRMALIGVWFQSGRGAHIPTDGTGYYVLAQNLAAGRGFQWEGIATTRRPPLYPLFIASLLPWSPFPLGVQLAQAVIGAFSCVALFGVGQALFNRRVGLIASALMAFDYLSVRQTVTIMTETLFVLPLILSFYGLIRAEREKKTAWLLGAGFFAGVSVLVRDVFIFYYPVMILWFLVWREPWKMRFYRMGLFLIPLLLVIGPWIVRNSLLCGRPVLITTGAVAQFYLANNENTSGGTTGGDWALGQDMAPPEGVRWSSSYTVDSEWERYLLKETFDFIRNHPGRFITLMGRKIVNTWRTYQTDSPRAARWAMALTNLPVLLLGLGGMLSQLKRWRTLFPIFMLVTYTFLLHAVFVSHMRYRYPVMPFFMVFAAFAFLKLWETVRTRLSIRESSYA